MAKDTKFKPGQSGNPSGRPKLPKDVRDVKMLTTVEFMRIANRFLQMNKEEIIAVAQDPKTVGLELMVASLISSAIKHGDQHRLGFLLDRLVGKIPDIIRVSGSDGGDIKVSVRHAVRDMMSDPEARAAIELLEKRVNKNKD